MKVAVVDCIEFTLLLPGVNEVRVPFLRTNVAKAAAEAWP